MGDSYPDVSLLWRTHAMLFMIALRRDRPDPDGYFQDWVDEAGGGDEQYVAWALRAYEEVRSWNAGELEEQRAIMGHLLRELERSRDSH